MERYSRMLLHFVWGLTRGARRVESFLFATRLTRVTRLIAERGTEWIRRYRGRSRTGVAGPVSAKR